MSLENCYNKMMRCDYHLHSEFSFDSEEKIEKICEKAVCSGVCEFALTDHAEFPLREAAPWPDFEKRESVIASCRKKYGKDLTIRSGIEVGQPWRDKTLEKKLMAEADPDFVIASVHELDGFPNPREIELDEKTARFFIETYLRQMTEMAKTCDYDVIGHATYLFRFLPERLADSDPPENYLEGYRALFQAIIHAGKGIEVNCSGLRMPSIQKTLPSVDLLKLYKELGGELVTVGSDGHSCRSAFLNLETGYEVLREAGFQYAVTYEKRVPSFYRT